MPRIVKSSTVTFEDGNIFISGELYGSESEYHSDCESGKLIIEEEKTFYEKWYDGDAGCTNLGGFQTALMQTYRVAGGNNRLILDKAFPDYFTVKITS